MNSSIYTNLIAQYTLQFAKNAALVLNEPFPSEWEDIIEKMILLFDSKKKIHPEYYGYSGQTIKQADVVLLGYPLMMKMDPDVRENDLVYYSQRTDSNGPAMTWSMHTIAYLELGQIGKGNLIFPKSYANIQPPFDVWRETPTGGAVNFLTGAGWDFRF